MKANREMSGDELAELLRAKLDQMDVSASGATVRITQDWFRLCRVKFRIEEGTTRITHVGGDATLQGILVIVGGLGLLALLFFAATGQVWVPGGVLIILAVFALRFLPARSLVNKVQETLEALPDFAQSDTSGASE